MAPGIMNTRIMLFPDDDPGIGFVVLQVDIVARLVFFDEVVLEQQGVVLGFYQHRADIADLPHQHGDAVVIVVFIEIATDPSLQVLCLTDVEDLSFCIEKLIHARSIRKSFDQLTQVLVLCGHFRSR